MHKNPSPFFDSALGFPRRTAVAACVLAWSLAGCGGGYFGNSSDSDSAPSAPLASGAQPGANGAATGGSSAAAPNLAVAVDPALSPSPVDAAAPSPVPMPAPIPTTALTSEDPQVVALALRPKPAVTTTFNAQRLADQASFGPTESLVAEIKTQGATAWVSAQLALPRRSFYTSGQDGLAHQSSLQSDDFCATRDANCWRDYFTTEPLLWDFYRNAMTQPDQLRQRVAFALQQLLVVNNQEVTGTYGFRNYQNMLLESAFSDYRSVLKKMALSPVMGDFLNNVNNNHQAPNENFAREILQLFSIGTCELNLDGTLKSGRCIPTYTNDTVRAYAFALTGWTYPAGGSVGTVCYPLGVNCRYYGGDMVVREQFHDSQERRLLSNVVLPAGHKTADALEKVLDSIMLHPNTAPYVAKHLIQQLVTSNPSPAYVGRVASAFQSGRYSALGTGKVGDLGAAVAAVLLDSEARSETISRSSGKLREPVLMFTGVLRALNGKTDGDALSWWWGQRLNQHMFRAPSVFNYYPPDHPVPNTTLVGPAFAIHDATTALERINFITYIIDWDGSDPSANVPNALGTKINITAFLSDAADATKLVDRLSVLALGEPLKGAARTAVINAVTWWDLNHVGADWKKYRVHTAALLIFSSPQYHVQR
jgi:uncharacterized protein (DUF1800 family)